MTLDAMAVHKLTKEIDQVSKELRRLEKTAARTAEARRDAKPTTSTLAEIDRLERSRIMAAQAVERQRDYLATLEAQARDSWR